MNSPYHHSFIPVEALTAKKQPEPVYWKSLSQVNSPVPLEQPESEKFDEQGVEIPESSRRRFVSLMAGSLALAGLTGCTRQPTETIMPYVDPPENVIPGHPKYYATAAPLHGFAQGVVVESHMGRPTKVEGNCAHPASLGASSVHAQACLMDLYNPDRPREITRLGVPTTWDAFQIGLDEALGPMRLNGGSGLRILTETVTSPTLGSQLQAVLKAFPAAKWHQYDPTGDHSARAAAQAVFGKPLNTYYQLSDADVIVSLDSDFLAFGPGSTRYARDFANRRRRGNRLDMNRLYAIESTMTSTGGKAEHRMPMRHGEIEEFARELAAALGAQGATSGQTSLDTAWIRKVAQDLQAHADRCVVIPGESQSPGVHAWAHAINASLGNIGKTVVHTEPIECEPVDQIASLRELIADMQAGKVQLLLILNGNPVYNAPADFPFTSALSKVKASVHLDTVFNETSLKTTWHVPESHFLEDWGDTRAFDGTASIIQPLIAPLYNSHTAIEFLDAVVQSIPRKAYDVVRTLWSAKAGASDFEEWWRRSVHDGIIQGSAYPSVTPKLNSGGAGNLRSQQPQAGAMEVVFRPDIYIHDGRYANNIWLQELPRPMTKLTWDNAVILSFATAKQLQVENQQPVEVKLGGKAIRGSVWILPGHPDNSIRLDLGFGRTQAGRAGNGAGFDAYPFRTSTNLWAASGATIQKLDAQYPLASTQMHQSMEGRDLVIANTVEGYRQNPNFVKEKVEIPTDKLTLYPEWDYKGYKWGMSIDLTACVNCNACVVACQAENNIPVVGKDQVLAARAMHWLRIDTYYKGDPGNPEAFYQPVPCMQCEKAPCELVCPVQATNHSSEGLNDMVYNRCVGTRYCSNNCPYKVRRFNFLLFQDWTTETLKLQRNPDVTVRSRGVMEKCTYCVQRIKEAEITSQVENRPINDGEILTACQQACPTEAIVFGDLNNNANRIAKLKAEKLDYPLLAELNTRPRTTYLAELKNPNPEFREGSSA